MELVHLAFVCVCGGGEKVSLYVRGHPGAPTLPSDMQREPSRFSLKILQFNIFRVWIQNHTRQMMRREMFLSEISLQFVINQEHPDSAYCSKTSSFIQTELSSPTKRGLRLSFKSESFIETNLVVHAAVMPNGRVHQTKSTISSTSCVGSV